MTVARPAHRPGLRAGRALLALVLALAVGLGPPAVDAEEDLRRAPIDVQVALADGGRCRDWADELPTLIVASGVQPGDRAGEADVCVRNRGLEDGRLTLGVVDRVETEVACSGDEALFDAGCGGAASGELGGTLTVAASIQDRCRGAFTALPPRTLSALDGAPVELDAVLRRNDWACVRLVVAFAPATEEAAAAAQTDSVSWRFAFDLIG